MNPEMDQAAVVDALCVTNNGFSGAMRRDQNVIKERADSIRPS